MNQLMNEQKSDEKMIYSANGVKIIICKINEKEAFLRLLFLLSHSKNELKDI